LVSSVAGGRQRRPWLLDLGHQSAQLGAGLAEVGGFPQLPLAEDPAAYAGQLGDELGLAVLAAGRHECAVHRGAY
jgi:hypothetical protein